MWPTAPTSMKINTACWTPKNGHQRQCVLVRQQFYHSPFKHDPDRRPYCSHLIFVIQSRTMHTSTLSACLFSLGMLVLSSSANPVGGTSLSYERWLHSLTASDAAAKRSNRSYPSKADCQSDAQSPGKSNCYLFPVSVVAVIFGTA